MIATSLPHCPGVAGAHGKTGTRFGRCGRIGGAAHRASTDHSTGHLLGNRFHAGQRLRRAQRHLQHADTARHQGTGHGHGMRHIVQDDHRDHRGVLHDLPGGQRGI